MDGQSPNFAIRSCVESREFAEAKSKLRTSERELDRVLSAMDMSLCRNPERYPIVVDSTELRVVVTEPIADIPRFRIFYTFDSEKVYMLHIEELPTEEF